MLDHTLEGENDSHDNEAQLVDEEQQPMQNLVDQQLYSSLQDQQIEKLPSHP